MLPPDAILQNRYRIVRRLGSGGMGTVYEAVDERVRATVALKETNVTGDDDSRREFEREARLLANLRHRSLPKVTDYFTEAGGEYLVMEYIPGHDLAELLKLRGAPFHLNLVLRLADELLGALEYLHGLDPPILHRDIKPANLKLTRREELYLLDFGLAKGAAGHMTTLLTSRSTRGYTLVYAPLEQILGQGTDPRSDLYSLGATLYHLLTNALPTDAPTRDERVEDGRPDPLLPICQMNPTVPASVAEVIHHAMAIRRRGRPESAAAMRAALRRAGGEMERADWPTVPLTSATLPAVGEEKPGVPAAQVSQELNGASDPVTQLDETLRDEPPQLAPSNGGGTTPRPVADTQSKVSPASRKNRPALIAALVIAAVVIAGALSLMLRTGAGGGRNTGLSPTPVSTPSGTAQAKYFTEDINGVPLEMAFIPGGTFLMGSPASEEGRDRSEGPQHSVAMQGFYMGKYEVTQAQWRVVAYSPKVGLDLDIEPSNFKGDDLPVENVSWEEATEFCRRLSRMTGREYRLPTEAEWEYAARAGTTTPFAFGETITPEIVNYDGNYPYGSTPKGTFREKTTPVGSLGTANGFGLYDMHGNVWEWCLDYWHDDYSGAPTDGSAWLDGGDSRYRVGRGGSWGNDAGLCRSARRDKNEPTLRDTFTGFRVVSAAR
jgi:formylglycine-generating enzyme required for sulfatase activity/predicted Ser/Thr protein kinase